MTTVTTANGSLESSHPTLDLLNPLVKDGPSSLTVKGVQEVRQRLESAITKNKKRGHDLLIDNYPTVSSHIRLATSLRGDYDKLQVTLQGLERDIDASDPETSFLPPVLSLLDRHFAAAQNKARAEAHVKALRSLSGITERMKKLEDAIWAGRGADEWVVEELAGHQAEMDGLEILRDTKAYKLSQDRIALFKLMVVEQLGDAFLKAISFGSGDGAEQTIAVQSRTTLQQPKIPRPTDVGSPARPSVPPPYSLSQVYNTLSGFAMLSSTLANLRARLVRDILPPLIRGECKVTQTTSDSISTFRLEKPSNSRQPNDILQDVASLLSFINNTIIPSQSSQIPERETFLAEMQLTTFRSILDSVIITSMPSSLSAIPSWLQIVHSALTIEEEYSAPSQEAVIKPFFETQAGETWANQRRRRVAEDARRLIVGGWGGWEARETEREKEVLMVVEVEVDEPEVNDNSVTKEDDGFGWGFDDDGAKSHSAREEVKEKTEEEDVNEWGFDVETPQAGPSSPRKSPQTTNGNHASAEDESMGDGWDFEDPVAVAPPSPPKLVAPVKPAREAKRLGKKVAKAKNTVDDDPWGSGSESMTSSMQAKAQTKEPVPESQKEPTQDDGWGWDEPVYTTDLPKEPPRAKRKELKEEKRTIRETFLVSRACDKLVDMADRVLQEAKELSSSSLPSPSFVAASDVLLLAAENVFDIHRSLLPSHFAPQLRDVPTLSMQLHNDALHLAARVEDLQGQYVFWVGADDIKRRLLALADHAFETQLAAQRDALMESIDEAEGFVVTTDIGLKRAERAIGSVVHNMESLGRVLKDVLPRTTYHIVLGYLLDEAVYRITSDILELQDITETESERLNELLKPIRPLEEIFVVDPGAPSNIVAHVPHWLKFCYISELLQANLVDILYLFDSGALIDFTTSELVSLLRALFADSEKRDNAIERIERGIPAAAAS